MVENPENNTEPTEESTKEPWIQFAIAVRASGWVSFGISEAGGMLGADIGIFESLKPETIIDSYSMESRETIVDDCQNWNLTSSTIENGWLIVEMSRFLDTRDGQDHRITDDSPIYRDPTRLLAAWGDQDEVGYHGFNRANSGIRLFINNEGTSEEGPRKRTIEEDLIAMSDGHFDIRESDYKIPKRETTYQYVCKTRDDLIAEFDLPDDQSLTVIGTAAVLTEETSRFVHHFVVTASYNRNRCDESNGQFITGWAPGSDPTRLPENVGIPMFGEDELQSIQVEIHYNNPTRESNQFDSSGIRVYYTLEPREHAAGTLILGDALVFLDGVTIGEGLTKWAFDCEGICSSLALKGESVTVISESLHMHQTGVRMTNEITRNNKVVHTGAVEVFEFEQQGSFRVQQDTFEVEPGDAFRTTCYYRDGTKFGLSSQEEMCQAYLLYYPAKRIRLGTYSLPWTCSYGIGTLVCDEELEYASLFVELQLGRTFGKLSKECPVPDEIIPEEELNTGEDWPELPSNEMGSSVDVAEAGINAPEESGAWRLLYSSLAWLACALFAL